MTSPLISICIPTKDRNDSLARLVESILYAAHRAHYTDYEIVIVDGAPGNLAKRLFAQNKRVRVYNGPGDATSARNIAGNKAQGHFLAFIDDDTWVGKDYFKQLNDTLKRIVRIPQIKGVTGNTIRMRNNTPLDDAWLHAGFDRFFTLSQQADFLRWGCTSNLIVRKEVFERVGGFRDPGLPVGGEDIDFGMRATSDGAFLSNPTLCVYHIPIEHSNISKIAKKAGYYGASEQWLVGLYPQYAHVRLQSYCKYISLLFAAPSNYTKRLRKAFLVGGIRSAFHSRRFVYGLSPLAMAIDIDPMVTEELSKELETAIRKNMK